MSKGIFWDKNVIDMIHCDLQTRVLGKRSIEKKNYFP